MIDWGYVAGYFDGEGTAHMRQKTPVLEWYNTNKESLDEMKKFLDVGRVVQKKVRDGYLPCFRLIVTKHENCLAVAKELVKVCIVKRPVLEEMIKTIEGHSYQRWKKVELTPIELDHLYNGLGFSVRQIAEVSGHGKSTIESAMRRMGIKRRPKGTRSPFHSRKEHPELYQANPALFEEGVRASIVEASKK